MNNIKDTTRMKRIANGLADSIESGVKDSGQRMISVLINDAESWLMDTYEKWKRGKALKPKYEELQRYIEASNESIQIGMDKKEIAVMWAMRKLDYSEEEINAVLDLANKAYLPKEES